MTTCLIVDDDEYSSEISERIIAPIGIKTVVKNDSVEALSHCMHSMPDIILLDMKMPKIDGFSFVNILRGMPGGDKPEIIACTGLCDSQSVLKLKNSGVRAYIVKPFSEDMLIDKIIKIQDVIRDKKRSGRG